MVINVRAALALAADVSWRCTGTGSGDSGGGGGRTEVGADGGRGGEGILGGLLLSTADQIRCREAATGVFVPARLCNFFGLTLSGGGLGVWVGGKDGVCSISICFTGLGESEGWMKARSMLSGKSGDELCWMAGEG